MGFGIIGSASKAYSNTIPWVLPLIKILAFFIIGLFFILLIPWILRWFMHKNVSRQNLRHPVGAHFYPTMPISIMIVALYFQMVGLEPILASFIWLIGAFSTIYFSVIIPFFMAKNENVKLEHINPGWFIPPVALLAIPLFGTQFLPAMSGIYWQFCIFLDYIGLGAGLFLYIALLSIIMHRILTHSMLPNNMAPAFWIGLGPIGAFIVASGALIQQSPFITVIEPYLLTSLIFWGFGVWWLMFAITTTLHYIRSLSLPYSLAWWAFIFPLGVFVVSSATTYSYFPTLSLIYWTGFILYILLIALWIITTYFTIVHLVKGNLFKLPKNQKQ